MSRKFRKDSTNNRDKPWAKFCDGKERFRDLEQAKRAASVIATRGGPRLRTYYCGRCNGHHLTSREEAC